MPMAAFKRGSRGLECLQALKELNCRASRTENLLRKTQGAAQSSSTIPWRGRDGTGCAASKEPLPRLRSLLTSSSTRVPSCSTWIQETDAKRGCHCSKRCPGSIQTHLALPGAWAVIPAAIEEPPFPKGKGPKFTLRGCLGTDTARPCQGRTPY